MRLKLRTQFAFLIVAVALFPIVFGLLVFTGQQAKRDPRESTEIFLDEVATLWSRNQTLTIEEIRMAGEQSGMPIINAALISPDGTVQLSSFRDLPEGIKLDVEDLARPPFFPRGGPRPELKFLPIDTNMSKSPLLLFDMQPFWSREDIRNRNFMLIASFALGALLVAGLMSFLILRSINKAIKNLIDDTATVASGKLDHEVKGSGAEELRSLAESINRMRITLRDMITRRMNMLIGVSHDLKTPIALIQGYTDALSDNMASDEATRIHYLEIIREKSAQLEDLVSDLIEFMKIDDFNMPQELVDIAPLLISLGKRFEEDARLLGLELTYGFGRLGSTPSKDAPLNPPKVRMNRMLFERAIENLISNAFRYTGPGGKVEFLMSVEEGQPVLTVADNGPGIPDEELAYIFDAFYRGTHSRKEAGHGLGLTIVKSVVDIHGWSVEARNRQTFNMTAGEPSAGGFRTDSVEHGLVVILRMRASA
jgi:signal transduction histidine kinase